MARFSPRHCNDCLNAWEVMCVTHIPDICAARLCLAHSVRHFHTTEEKTEPPAFIAYMDIMGMLAR